MNKNASFGEFIDNIAGKASGFYRDKVTDTPVKHMAANSVIGGGLGYLGGSAGANMLAGFLSAGKSPQEKAIMQAMLSDNTRLKTIGTVLGALLGAGLAGHQHADYGSRETLKKSLTDKDYWQKNPGRLADQYIKALSKMNNKQYRSAARKLHFQ